MTERESTYRLLDSGDCRKLEQVGPYKIVRPAPNAAYKISDPAQWEGPDATYIKSDQGGGDWQYRRPTPESFSISLPPFTVKIKLTPFGHIGIFPEQRANWDFVLNLKTAPVPPLEILNLFAYSGVSTLACLKRGFSVCHVDSAKGMVDWAAENARLSGLAEGKVRWIVDDVLKFVRREVKRGRKYDGFILDPPSFGRGAKGEVWKLERDLPELMEAMMAMCGGSPTFIILSCFTLGFGPANLDRILRTYLPSDARGAFSSVELVIPESSGRVHPRGACAYYAAPGVA